VRAVLALWQGMMMETVMGGVLAGEASARTSLPNTVYGRCDRT
jgi:hypothetical protein